MHAARALAEACLFVMLLRLVPDDVHLLRRRERLVCTNLAGTATQSLQPDASPIERIHAQHMDEHYKRFNRVCAWFKHQLEEVHRYDIMEHALVHGLATTFDPAHEERELARTARVPDNIRCVAYTVSLALACAAWIHHGDY